MQRINYEITSEDKPYGYDIYMSNYKRYTFAVKNYFKGNESFLSINLSDKTVKRIWQSLNLDERNINIPHLDKSIDLL
jgi:hypothetical protein